MVNYLRDSAAFAEAMSGALPTVCTLLGSKQTSDVQEAIHFFVSAFEFGFLKVSKVNFLRLKVLFDLDCK